MSVRPSFLGDLYNFQKNWANRKKFLKAAEKGGMSSPIRVFEPGIVYAIVIRAVDRQFVFKPDHNPRYPLLAAGCPMESFERFSKTLPDPSVINIVGAAAARAKELAEVNLHWVEANSSHLQTGISVSRAEDVGKISAFFRNFHSAVARKLGKKWKWDGHVFSGKYRATPCLDDESAEQQLVYSVTNPVKDCLVGRVLESPYFTTFRHLAHGKLLKYFRIDWDAYNATGAARKKRHCVQDYVKWHVLEIVPVPAQEDWPDHKRQAWARAQIKAIEEQMEEELRKQGREPMGVPAQFRTDPRGRPNNPKVSGPKPLCHCKDPEIRAEFKRQWRETLSKYREASTKYREGSWEWEFPEGTFRPPLIKPYHSSSL